jgi:hypothetical protein
MFEHVTILLSFVFAIALTHLLSTATELVLARDRVRFSGLHALWMANALLLLLINWLSLWGLVIIKHWTVPEVVLQFAAAIMQYFQCSTLAIRAPDRGSIDVPAIFEKHRHVIFAAFAATAIIAMIQNYWDRNNSAGLSSTAWIVEDLGVVPALIAALIAGWARPQWLQWLAGLAMTAISTVFLVIYAMPA